MDRSDIELIFEKVVEAGEPLQLDRSGYESEAARTEAAEIDELRRISLETSQATTYSYTTT